MGWKRRQRTSSKLSLGWWTAKRTGLDSSTAYDQAPETEKVRHHGLELKHHPSKTGQVAPVHSDYRPTRLRRVT